MTPAEVVAAEDASLMLTGASLDDPDFRVSVWEARCPWCPKSPELQVKPTLQGAGHHHRRFWDGGLSPPAFQHGTGACGVGRPGTAGDRGQGQRLRVAGP
jgi:hypothetical protein